MNLQHVGKLLKNIGGLGLSTLNGLHDCSFVRLFVIETLTQQMKIINTFNFFHFHYFVK